MRYAQEFGEGKNRREGLITWQETEAWGGRCLKDLEGQECPLHILNWLPYTNVSPSVSLNHSKVWCIQIVLVVGKKWKSSAIKWNANSPSLPSADPTVQEAEVHSEVNTHTF